MLNYIHLYSRHLARYLASSSVFSCVLFFGYLYFYKMTLPHLHFKLDGFLAFAACSFVAFSVLYFVRLAWQRRYDLPGSMRPTGCKLALALMVYVMTPLAIWLFIPFPVGFILLFGIPRGIFNWIDGKAGCLICEHPALIPLAVLAYVVSCIALSPKYRWGTVSLLVIVYLCTVYIAEVLITGVRVHI